MIKVTDEAKVKLLALMKEEGKDSDAFVRVGVNSGGCSGLSYDLGFDNNENEDDKSFEDNGIKIVVNKKSYLYLIGTILEYSGGCLLYTSPSPRDGLLSRMPSSA